MLKKKKIFYSILFILVISIFIEVCFFNNNFLSYRYDSNIYKELNVEQAKFINVDRKDSSTVVSRTNDPQIEFNNLDMSISDLELELKYKEPGAILQVFYTTSGSPNFSEENSMVYDTSIKEEYYKVFFKSSVQVKSLRIDVSNKSNDEVIIKGIRVNNEGKFIFKIERLLLTIIALVFIFLIYMCFSRYGNYIIRYRYIISLVIFSILVLGKFHGSSIGLWDHYIKNNDIKYESSKLIGKERGVRGDEYIVHTPWLLAQSESNKFIPVTNENIRSDGQRMTMTNVPTLSLDLIAKPQFFGFILFDKEYGFSWYWNFKIIILILLSFEICYFLSRGNSLLSVLGAFWIGLSPSVQWWFDTPASVVELIIYAEGIIVSTLFYLNNKGKTAYRLWGIFFFAISIIGYITVVYPAIQVPLGYVILIFLISILFSNWRKAVPNKKELIFGLCCAVFIIITLLIYILNSLEAFKLLAETDYPGHRVSRGGGFQLGLLQLDLINWLLPFREATFSNSSELSAFFNYIPLLVLVFFSILKFEIKEKKLIIALYSYFIFQISWLFIRYPEFFAKITFFSYVPESRLANIVLGLTATYLTIWLAAMIQKHKPFKMYEILIYCFIIGVIYIYSLWQTPMVGFTGTKLALLTTIIFVLLNYLLLSGKLKSFSIIFLGIIIISGATVNPIARGLTPIYDKVISKEILKIKQYDPNARWAAANSPVNGQLLVALGVRTINSVHFYPDIKMWSKFDSDGSQRTLYNRYAHVYFSLNDKGTMFNLIQKDVLLVDMAITDLQKAEIKYILIKGSQELLGNSLFKMKFHDDVNDMYIYEVNLNH